MLHTIVEGEPGIFPDPVARVMRRLGGWFDRRRPAQPVADEPPTADAGDEPASDHAAHSSDHAAHSSDDSDHSGDHSDHSGESR